MATSRDVADVVSSSARKPIRKIGARVSLGVILSIAPKVLGTDFSGDSAGILADAQTIITKQTEDDVFPELMRKSFGKKVGWTCQLCGRKFSDGWLLEFHHLVLRCLGGRHTEGNMACLCLRCHYKVHRFLEFFGIGGNSSTLIRKRITAGNDCHRKTSWDGFWLFRVLKHRKR